MYGRRRSQATALGLVGLVWLSTALAGPGEEIIRNLAALLAEELQDEEVALPDGSRTMVLSTSAAGQTAGADDDRTSLLNEERIRICLDTIFEAEAGPVAWLVVQQQELDFDLVMRVEIAEDFLAITPDFLFTTPRREWHPGDVKPLVRPATGRKPPRKGLGNLVIQGFSTRIETTYVYERAPAGPGAEGLAALLQEGSLIREARRVDLGDGNLYTLALVLRHATFVPSDCSGCAAAVFGHADSGEVSLVLASDRELLHRLDVTPQLRGVNGSPLLPRYRCERGDEDPGFAERPFGERFSAREPVELLRLQDLDMDGRSFELSLPAERRSCRPPSELIVGIRFDDSNTPALAVIEKLTTP